MESRVRRPRCVGRQAASRLQDENGDAEARCVTVFNHLTIREQGRLARGRILTRAMKNDDDEIRLRPDFAKQHYCRRFPLIGRIEKARTGAGKERNLANTRVSSTAAHSERAADQRHGRRNLPRKMATPETKGVVLVMIQPLTLSKGSRRFLGVGRDKLLALHKAKRVRALDLDGRLRFTTESLQAFLGSLPDSLGNRKERHVSNAPQVAARSGRPDSARADCALTTMGEFQGRTRSDVDTAVTDLICCLMHSAITSRTMGHSLITWTLHKGTTG